MYKSFGNIPEHHGRVCLDPRGAKLAMEQQKGAPMFDDLFQISDLDLWGDAGDKNSLSDTSNVGRWDSSNSTAEEKKVAKKKKKSF